MGASDDRQNNRSSIWSDIISYLLFLRRGHELLVPEPIKPWFDATEKNGSVTLRERRLSNDKKTPLK